MRIRYNVTKKRVQEAEEMLAKIPVVKGMTREIKLCRKHGNITGHHYIPHGLGNGATYGTFCAERLTHPHNHTCPLVSVIIKEDK